MSALRAVEWGAGSPTPAPCEELVHRAHELGIHDVELVAWRDLDDLEAGGSELHSHRIASVWADAGLDVTFRTSAVPNGREVLERCGYRAVRRDGRYGIFPAVAYEGIKSRSRRSSGPDALVEVWNGMPFFSPLWFRGPSIVFLHHVHAEMWDMVLPSLLAAMGRRVESVVAPLVYRKSAVLTLSQSSRDEIVSMLGIPRHRISVVPPGVDTSFHPDGERSPNPLVVAVGRLVPVKRFDMLFEALFEARARHPDLKAVVVGEGYERDKLEAKRRTLGAEDWLSMPGKLAHDGLVDLYRRAWVVASSSLREGWGMTLTEAGACGTPAVATRIAGHRDAVVDGVTGVLVDTVSDLAEAVSRLLEDEAMRRRMGKAALAHARKFTWENTAAATLGALVVEAESGSGRGRPRARSS